MRLQQPPDQRHADLRGHRPVRNRLPPQVGVRRNPLRREQRVRITVRERGNHLDGGPVGGAVHGDADLRDAHVQRSPGHGPDQVVIGADDRLFQLHALLGKEPLLLRDHKRRIVHGRSCSDHAESNHGSLLLGPGHARRAGSHQGDQQQRHPDPHEHGSRHVASSWILIEHAVTYRLFPTGACDFAAA